MRPGEAKKILETYHAQGIITFDPKRGLIFTEKAAGVALEEVCAISSEQVSRLGEDFHPLADTIKRVKGLLGDGVKKEVLRGLLQEMGVFDEDVTPAPLDVVDDRPATIRASYDRIAQIEKRLAEETDPDTLSDLQLEADALRLEIQHYEDRELPVEPLDPQGSLPLADGDKSGETDRNGVGGIRLMSSDPQPDDEETGLTGGGNNGTDTTGKGDNAEGETLLPRRGSRRTQNALTPTASETGG